MLRLRKIFIALLCLAFLQTADAAWEKQNSNTLAWLRDVYFFDEDHGFAAGSGGTFLETRDGGATWTKRVNFTSDTILQIHFSDADNGWLLCERDRFSRGENSLSYLLKTTDGGAVWEKIEFQNAGRARASKIFFNPRGKGFAVGEGGAFFESSESGAWVKQSSPVRPLLLAGAFYDPAGGAVVGAGGSVYFTVDAGASWNQANVSGNPKTKFYAVFFADARNGWIVGADGTILRTETGGRVWTADTAPTRHRLEKIVFAGSRGFAVGFGGTILVSDGGAKKSSAAARVLQKRNP